MPCEIIAWYVTKKSVLNSSEFLANSKSSFFMSGRVDLDIPDTLDADIICLPLILSPFPPKAKAVLSCHLEAELISHCD